jgi:predicted methyltransferase
LVTHDFHQPLMPDLQGEFDTVFLDAPAELEELVVALSRAQDALRAEGGRIFLSYAQNDPAEMLEAQREMLEVGFLIAQMLPRFDRFTDGTSADLYVLQTADWSVSLAPVTTQPPGSNGSG